MKKSIFDIGATYTFNVSAKTITFSGLPSGLNIANFLLVVNMTTNTIIFQLGGGTNLSGSFAGSVLTLNASLDGMNNTDKLIAFLDIDSPQEVVNPDGSNIGTEWISGNIDTTDSTYYYFLSFLPGTTNWRIKRMNKSTFIVDYATGDSDLQDAWDDRTTHTYLISY